MSENGLSTSKWGPSTWIFLHSVAQRFPNKPTEEDKQYYKLFYENIKNILPCSSCKESYTIFLKILPIQFFLNKREHLIFWIYTIHNFVNYKLKGKGKNISKIPTFNDIYRKFENFSK